jgi:hypothetical protein
VLADVAELPTDAIVLNASEANPLELAVEEAEEES